VGRESARESCLASLDTADPQPAHREVRGLIAIMLARSFPFGPRSWPGPIEEKNPSIKLRVAAQRCCLRSSSGSPSGGFGFGGGLVALFAPLFGASSATSLRTVSFATPSTFAAWRWLSPAPPSSTGFVSSFAFACRADTVRRSCSSSYGHPRRPNRRGGAHW
jgi:hypothetical protein